MLKGRSSTTKSVVYVRFADGHLREMLCTEAEESRLDLDEDGIYLASREMEDRDRPVSVVSHPLDYVENEALNSPEAWDEEDARMVGMTDDEFAAYLDAHGIGGSEAPEPTGPEERRPKLHLVQRVEEEEDCDDDAPVGASDDLLVRDADSFVTRGELDEFARVLAETMGLRVKRVLPGTPSSHLMVAPGAVFLGKLLAALAVRMDCLSKQVQSLGLEWQMTLDPVDDVWFYHKITPEEIKQTEEPAAPPQEA